MVSLIDRLRQLAQKRSGKTDQPAAPDSAMPEALPSGHDRTAYRVLALADCRPEKVLQAMLRMTDRAERFDATINDLLNRGLIRYADPGDKISLMTATELQVVLKSHQLRFTGKKADLATRVRQNIPQAQLVALVRPEPMLVRTEPGETYYRELAAAREAEADAFFARLCDWLKTGEFQAAHAWIGQWEQLEAGNNAKVARPPLPDNECDFLAGLKTRYGDPLGACMAAGVLLGWQFQKAYPKTLIRYWQQHGPEAGQTPDELRKLVETESVRLNQVRNQWFTAGRTDRPDPQAKIAELQARMAKLAGAGKPRSVQVIESSRLFGSKADFDQAAYQGDFQARLQKIFPGWRITYRLADDPDWRQYPKISGNLSAAEKQILLEALEAVEAEML